MGVVVRVLVRLVLGENVALCRAVPVGEGLRLKLRLTTGEPLGDGL